jgi:hypothetical protein
MVEYVLMLVVSVAMVTAVAYQIFRPMQTFLKDYMGTYVSCLLETGELPSLGNETTQQILSDEGCNAKFQSATVAHGRPPISGSSSSSAQGQANNKNSESNSSSSGAGGSGSGSGGSASNRPPDNGRNLLTRPKNRSGTDGAAASNGKTTEIPIDPASSKFYNRRTTSDYNNVDPSKRFAIGGSIYSDEEKKKKLRDESGSASIRIPEGIGPGPKKTVIKKQERQVAAAEDEPMTFGNFFRFLLIAAIVIAIIVVLGSQALKIAKSQEK